MSLFLVFIFKNKLNNRYVYSSYQNIYTVLHIVDPFNKYAYQFIFEKCVDRSHVIQGCAVCTI